MSTPYPYSHAPRLPETGPIQLGDWVRAGTDGIELEVGPGRGGFLFERLAVAPDVGMVGLEVRRKWATLVDDRLRGEGLGERGRVFAEDVRRVLPRVVPETVSRLYVHFPDPWWKKRHAKRRVVDRDFLTQAVRVLRAGGEILVQTDVPDRAQEYAALLDATPGLVRVSAPPWTEDHPFVARSPRERRAMQDGYPILRLLFRRA